MSKYPNVKNAHIVPRTYLANFARDGKIGVHVDRSPEALIQSVENVGTRRRYYRRHRPDGTPIDDMEWSLQMGETAAGPVLRKFAEEWPLQLEQKAVLAELFAYQLLRGPRWEAEQSQATEAILDELRDAKGYGEHEIAKGREVFRTNTYRFTHMLGAATTIASVFASMHWTLLEFRSRRVATSDHPVVLWPLASRSRPPQPTPVRSGVIKTFEVRVPLSPRHAVLMTWADYPESEHARRAGSRDHAVNLNAFSVAQADRQWFHHPDGVPPVGSGTFLPLGIELVPGYTFEAAARSARRAQTFENVQPKINRDLDDREISVVYLHRKVVGPPDAVERSDEVT